MDSINTFGDVKVYKNKFTVPFGVTYDQIVSRQDFLKFSSGQKDFGILRACVIDDEDMAAFAALKKFNPADTLNPITFEKYQEYVDNLKKDKLSITKFSENKITGKIATAEPKILFLSMPFDEGWKVTVNGLETPLHRLNCGLTGLVTQKGNNDIELTFTPRYKKQGGIVSIVSLLAFISLIAINRFRNKPKTDLA